MGADWVRMVGVTACLLIVGFLAALCAHVAQAAPVARGVQQATVFVAPNLRPAALDAAREWRVHGVPIREARPGERPDVTVRRYCGSRYGVIGTWEPRSGVNYIWVNVCADGMGKRGTRSTLVHEMGHEIGIRRHLHCRSECIMAREADDMRQWHLTARDVRAARRIG